MNSVGNFGQDTHQGGLFSEFIYAKDIWTHLHAGLAAAALIGVNNDFCHVALPSC